MQPHPMQPHPIQPRPMQPRPMQPRPMQPRPMQPRPTSSHTALFDMSCHVITDVGAAGLGCDFAHFLSHSDVFWMGLICPAKNSLGLIAFSPHMHQFLDRHNRDAALSGRAQQQQHTW
jgi:hypothetical protein